MRVVIVEPPRDKDLNVELLRGGGEPPFSLSSLEVKDIIDEILGDKKLEIIKSYSNTGITEIVITVPSSDKRLITIGYIDMDEVQVDFLTCEIEPIKANTFKIKVDETVFIVSSNMLSFSHDLLGYRNLLGELANKIYGIRLSTYRLSYAN